ncbi:Uncharacterised protein [Salmonella bongori]|nr:Uncharacterised protein [Salmonella bongori]
MAEEEKRKVKSQAARRNVVDVVATCRNGTQPEGQ